MVPPARLRSRAGGTPLTAPPARTRSGMLPRPERNQSCPPFRPSLAVAATGPARRPLARACERARGVMLLPAACRLEGAREPGRRRLPSSGPSAKRGDGSAHGEPEATSSHVTVSECSTRSLRSAWSDRGWKDPLLARPHVIYMGGREAAATRQSATGRRSCTPSSSGRGRSVPRQLPERSRAGGPDATSRSARARPLRPREPIPPGWGRETVR